MQSLSLWTPLERRIVATILVIDDKAVNREYLRTLLGYGGHCVLESEDGTQALEQLRKTPVDLVIVDGVMPGLDGFEFVRQIRTEAAWNTIPVIFHSAYYKEGHGIELAKRAGANYVLPKPAEPATVLRIVDEALRESSRPVATEINADDFHREHDCVMTETLLKQGRELEVANNQLSTIATEFQRQVEHQTADLRSSNVALEKFASVAAHDLQAPLNSVIGYSEILAEASHGKLNCNTNEVVDAILAGATRMQQLIQSVLAYSRVEGSRTPLVSTDCHTALARALRNLATEIAKTNAVVTHDALPTLTADPTQLEQLFQNLVGNAIKFCKADTPRIHVGAQERESDWMFSVRDNGIGIDPQAAERLFHLFVRLHSAAEYPGSGIGLATCKRIVERHGGRIWVESQPGNGATFYFTVNRAVVSTETKSDSAAPLASELSEGPDPINVATSRSAELRPSGKDGESFASRAHGVEGARPVNSAASLEPASDETHVVQPTERGSESDVPGVWYRLAKVVERIAAQTAATDSEASTSQAAAHSTEANVERNSAEGPAGDQTPLSVTAAKESKTPDLTPAGEAPVAKVEQDVALVGDMEPGSKADIYTRVDAPEKSSKGHGEKTVLIADDDNDFLQMLSLRCSQMGLKVIRSPDAMHALLGAHRVRPDLIMLDVHMPGGDGLAVCEMMGSDETLWKVPVIIMSGDPNEEIPRRCETLQVEYLPKGEAFWDRLKPIIQRLLGLSDASPTSDVSPCQATSVTPSNVQSPADNIPHRPKILCIDDDPEISACLKMRLEPLGVDVLRAFNGMQGYWTALHTQPELIILDLMMPEGGGNYIVGRLRAHPLTAKIPVLMLTSVNTPGVRRLMIGLGVDGFLTKPVDFTKLLEHIREYVPLADGINVPEMN
jgi:CheY-like chemotaxis protein